MKPKCCITIVAMLAVLALWFAACSAKEKKGVEIGQTAKLSAEVVAVNQADRIVSLRGAEGNVLAVKVGQEAHNFDQIEVGDKVNVEYVESVALFLGAPGQEPEASASQVVKRAPKGEMPAGVEINTVDVSATVEDIDRENRTVTLKRPDGRLVTTRVDESVKAFDTLKVGDTVHARYTQAVAVSVEKP